MKKQTFNTAPLPPADALAGLATATMLLAIAAAFIVGSLHVYGTLTGIHISPLEFIHSFLAR